MSGMEKILALDQSKSLDELMANKGGTPSGNQSRNFA
jgi:hypothetical protein